MKNPFELLPLIVAAIAGGIFLTLAEESSTSMQTTFLTGAAIGVAVQITVRVTGVS